MNVGMFINSTAQNLFIRYHHQIEI